MATTIANAQAVWAMRLLKQIQDLTYSEFTEAFDEQDGA